MVMLMLGTVERDTDRVKPGQGQPFYSFRQAAIGVEVDSTPIGLLANKADALLHYLGLQQRFPFTPLAKAGNGPGSTF